MKKQIKIEKTGKKVKEKIKFPRITIAKAVDIVRKVINRYGSHIIPYSEFARILGVKSPKGGSYQIKIEALKLYGLMDRFSFSEITLLDKGKQILEAKTEEEQKKIMFEAVLTIPIMKKLYERYKDGLPQKRKPIVDYLINVEHMDKREAGRLTGVFISDYKLFFPLIPLYVGKPEQFEKEKLISGKTEEINDFYRMIKIIGSLFPLEEEIRDVKKMLNQLSDLAKKHNLKTFYGLIEGLKIYADNPEELKKVASKVVETFESDTGIKLKTIES